MTSVMSWGIVQALLFDTFASSSIIVQCGIILWCVMFTIGCQLMYRQQLEQFGRVVGGEKCSPVVVVSSSATSEVALMNNRKSKRVVVEAAVPTTPTVRMSSMETQNVATRLQVRCLNLLSQFLVTSSRNGTSKSTYETNVRPLPVPVSLRKPVVISLRRTFYGVIVYLLILLFFGNASMSTANAVTNYGSSSRPSEWYIVLVSIPVLDKVLPLKNLAEELLNRGYRVGFALPENCRHWVMDLDRLEFISLGHISVKSRGNTVPSDDEYPPMDEILHTDGVYESYAASMRYYQSYQRPMFDALVEDLEDDRPDLVIIDRYTFAGFDACHALHIPYVVNSPMLLLDLDSPPAYIPAPFSNFTILTTRVLDRCLNSIYRFRFRVVMIHLFEQVNAVRRERGLPPITSKHDLYGNAMVLVNSVFGLDDARPIAPQFSMIGRLESARERNNQHNYETLPIHIKDWLENTQKQANPIIFINFPLTTRLSLEIVNTLMEGLESVNARVIWKVTLEEVMAVDMGTRTLSSMLFLSSFEDDALLLDQLPISLLITAGDYTSIQDAASKSIPILGLPWTAEQWEVMNAIVRIGAGIAIQSPEFTASNIYDAATVLLYTPSYREAAFYMGELLKTGGGSKKAVDNIETVLEYGAGHTLPRTNVQPLYKTYLVDVYLVYGAILCGAAVILKTLFSVLYSIFEFAPDVHLGVTLDSTDEGKPLGAHCSDKGSIYSNCTNHNSHHHRKDKSV